MAGLVRFLRHIITLISHRPEQKEQQLSAGININRRPCASATGASASRPHPSKILEVSITIRSFAFPGRRSIGKRKKTDFFFVACRADASSSSSISAAVVAINSPGRLLPPLRSAPLWSE
ncbi:hypothetical protein E2562_008848 [Oryza meyeriana var. granulata]|uniref:Uncharacterized protein n=1 Tax=Oryza meyeriana var. granulata TaxID=110450 RepID=A0A6G1D042_9ORYZ|nr:hypothetical protein E2562_008848 [Oryza meyeriana var. granulata]